MTISFTVPSPGNDTITLNGANDYGSSGQTDVFDEVDGVIINYTQGCVYPLDFSDLSGDPPPAPGPWRWDDFINFPNDGASPNPNPGDDLLLYVYYADTGDGGNSCQVEWDGGEAPQAVAPVAPPGGQQQVTARDSRTKRIKMNVIPQGATNVTVTLDAGFAGYVFLSRVKYDADHHISDKAILVGPLAQSNGAAQTVHFPAFDFSHWDHVHVAVVVQKHAGRPVGQRLKPYEGVVHGNKT